MFPGADFTNTFHLLSRVPWPEEGNSEKATVGPVVDLILEQCASIEELKVATVTSEGVHGGFSAAIEKTIKSQ